MKRKIALFLGILMLLVVVLPVLSRANTVDSYLISGGQGEYIDESILQKIEGKSYKNVSLPKANFGDLKSVAEFIINNESPKEITILLSPETIDRTTTEAGKLIQAGGDFQMFYNRYRSGNNKIEIDTDSIDSQHIGTLDVYKKTNQGLTKLEDKTFKDLESYRENLKKLKSLADEKDVKLKVALLPINESLLNSYKTENIDKFINTTLEVTDTYNYLYSSISRDDRYFYDKDILKSSAINMIIRDIFELEGYKLENIGGLIKKGEKLQRTDAALNNERQLIALMLHNIDDSVQNSANISQKRLRQLLRTIKDKGHTTVGLSEIQDYVFKGVELPEKPVVLTFDDGYISNYTLAYPIFKEYNMKAVYFPIGHSIGKDTYKDTGQSITPHYTLEQMKEMKGSGLIDFGTHGYDIHQVAHLEEGVAMESILQPEGMEKDQYEKQLNEDFEKMAEVFEGSLGFRPSAMAYPRGDRDVQSDKITRQNGIVTSFTVTSGTNYLIKGLPQSMFNLNRINIDEQMDLNSIFK